ncbi:hypothetical protein D3C85_1617870 [compost metagenome]
MNDDRVDKFGLQQLIPEGGEFRITGAVVKFEGDVGAGLQVTHHRQDRGNTDASGDEDELSGILDQLELILRCCHRQQVACLDIIGHAHRTASSVGITLDRNDITLTLLRVVAQ